MARQNYANGIIAGAWTNVIIGLIVAAVPFFSQESGSAFWNNVIVGLAVAILAGYNAWAARNAARSVSWAASINIVLGIWLIASPFVFATGGFHLWADVILGAILALVAAYNTYAGNQATRRVRGRAI